MNPTDAQLKARLAATGYTQAQLDNPTQGALPQAIPQPVATTPTISLDTLQNPQTPLQVPQFTQTPPANVNLQPYIDQAKTFFAPNPQEAELANVYQTLFGEASQGGRAAARTAAGQAAGLPDKQKAYQSAINKLTALQAESDTLEQRLQASVEGRGVTAGGLAPIRNAQQRDLAVRQRFAAADALVAQGDYQSAKEQTDQAVEDQFADRTDRLNALAQYGQYLSQQIERDNLRVDKATELAIKERQRVLDEEKAQLEEEKQTKKDIAGIALEAAKNNADKSVIDRINSATTIQQAIANAGSALYSPTTTTVSLGNGQTQLIDAKTGKVIATYGTAKADSSGFKAPEVKNINGTDMQWNPYSGVWEPITTAGGNQASQSLSQLEFLRDTTARILGDKEKGYDPLYKKSSQSPITRTIAYTATGTTGQARLETYVDTLRSNMLTLATDPSIKKFFGPQMSNADVRLMTAAGTTLRPDSQTPEELKAEALRIDDWLNRAETAVRNGVNQQTTQNKVITAPDGTMVEIID